MSEKSNYNKNLRAFACKLRNDSTKGEIILWSQVIKAKKMYGISFNRQFSLKLDDTNMIVDFISRKLKLIIEVDGYSHNFKGDNDTKRDFILSEYGYTVIRILESDIKYDLGNVIRVIEAIVIDLKEPDKFSLSEEGLED